jgi:hypothetical protein
LILVIVPLMLRWLSSGSTRPGAPGTLAYGTKHRVFAVVLTLALVLMVGGVAIAHPPKGRDLLIALGMLAFFAALVTPLLLEFYRVHFVFDELGVSVNSPWSPKRTLRWSDVRAVRWRSSMKWLDLTDASGIRVHLSPWLMGLDHFARLAVVRIPNEVIGQDRDTLAVLELMQQGRAGELVWANDRPSALLGR